jgi:2C-methyl-D-erythritol 2,4-cyclodiphosphate synthase
LGIDKKTIMRMIKAHNHPRNFKSIKISLYKLMGKEKLAPLNVKMPQNLSHKLPLELRDVNQTACRCKERMPQRSLA